MIRATALCPAVMPSSNQSSSRQPCLLRRQPHAPRPTSGHWLSAPHPARKMFLYVMPRRALWAMFRSSPRVRRGSTLFLPALATAFRFLSRQLHRLRHLHSLGAGLARWRRGSNGRGPQTILGTAYIQGIGSGGLGVLIPGNIVPVAGDGEGKSIPVLDGISAEMAELDQPASVALDGLGNLYIADVYHHRIRMVCGGIGATINGTVCTAALAGVISTIAGNGIPAYTGDGGLAASATINTPAGITLDGAGNLYIADSVNNVIRKITAATGVIETIVGFKNAEGAGGSGYGGDGGPATSALLNTPWGVSVDAFGYLYVADTFNHRIRKLDIASGVINTVAGNGVPGYSGDGVQATNASLNVPYAVAFDTSQNMYIPDSANNRVRMVSQSGIITTFAGVGSNGFSGDGAAPAAAQLWSPSGVAVDAGGNVYIADTQNSAIRKVTAAGIISTVAQNDVGVYFYNGSGPFPVSIYWPWGMALDGQGDLYFADFLNLRVREIQGNVSPVDFTHTPIRQGYQSKPATIPVELENDGNAPLDLVSIASGSNAVLQQSALDPTLQPCSATGQNLVPDADCWIEPVFAPAAFPALTSDQTEFGNINIAANSTPGLSATNSPLQVEVVGIATPVNSTTTTLVSDPNPSGFGQSVTFTATIATGAGTGDLTGGVAFYDGATLLGPSIPVLESGGATQAVASFSISTLTVGSHTITAVYDTTKDLYHFSSSISITQLVLEGTVTTLTASEKTANVGDTVLFTATISAANGGGYPLDGSVTFTNGSTILCTQSINASGVATCSTVVLTQGINQVIATYTPASTTDIQPSIGFLSFDVQTPSNIQIAIGGIQAQATGVFYGNPVTILATVSGSGTTASAPAHPRLLPPARSLSSTARSRSAPAPLPALRLRPRSLLPLLRSAPIPLPRPIRAMPTTSPASRLPSPLPSARRRPLTFTALPATAIAGAPVALVAAITVTQGVATPTGTITFTTAVRLRSGRRQSPGTATVSPVFAPGVQSIVATYSGDADSSAAVSPRFPSRSSSPPPRPRLPPVPIPPSFSRPSLSQPGSPATEACPPAPSPSAPMAFHSAMPRSTPPEAPASAAPSLPLAATPSPSLTPATATTHPPPPQQLPRW